MKSIIKHLLYFNKKELIINNYIEDKLRDGLIINIKRGDIMDTKKEFEMNDKKIATIKELTFSDFKVLKHLNLSHNHIIELNENIFVGLDQLEILNLTKNKLKSINLKTVFSKLTNLKELILRENEIESLAENSFQRMNKLERLDMGTNKLKAINETMFSRDLRELKEIDLSHNEITVFNMDIVSNEDNQGIYES